jgi:hypothetical protein
MNRRELGAILLAHADGLIEGDNQADQLLIDHPEMAAELRPLFDLAASIQAVLVPVKAPVTFVNRLRMDLMTYSGPKISIKAPISGQKVLLMGVAAAGSVLSVVGLAVLMVRRLRGTGKTEQRAVTAV